MAAITLARQDAAPDRYSVAVPDTPTPTVTATVPAPRPAGAALAAWLSTAVLAALVAADGPTGLRIVLALVALLGTPGIAIVGLLGLPRSAARAALTIAVSLSVAAIVSESLVLTGALTPENGVMALLAASAPFVLAQLVVQRRRGAAAPSARARRLRLQVAKVWTEPHRTPFVLTAAAVALWVAAALTVEPRRASELGMISALPVIWWAGLATLTVAFVLHLRRGPNPVLATAQLGGLIAFLYVTMTVSEPYSRIPTSYTHVGLVDYLVRDHRIVQFFDARFSWPGSLSTGAMLTQLAGASSSAAFVKWALPLFIALWALGVYAVAAAYSPSPRTRWLTVWVFLSLNWVGQDYWSSQALNFFFVVTVVAAVATWFPRRILGARSRFLAFEQPAHAFTTSAQGLGLLFTLVVVTVAIASSHQLSPFTLVGVLLALWLVDRRDIRLLPAVALVVAVTWISWGADDYWIGHFSRLTEDVGHVTGVVTTGTVDRISDGSLGRRLVLGIRLGLSLLAWAAAGLWVWRAARRGRTSLVTVGALAVVPIGFVALQSYGGELGLRIFLFSLPFVALLIADALDAFLRHRWARRALATTALTGVALAVTAGFVVARYGNEQFEQTYAEDVAATRAFAEIAPPGSHLFGTNTSNPFRMLPYHDYRPHKDDVLVHPEETPVEKALRDTGVAAGYILVYEGSIKESFLRQGGQPGWYRELERQLLDLGAKERFRDRRAALFEYSLEGVEPLAPPPGIVRPFVTARARALLGTPSLVFALVVAALLVLASALHVTGVRWRPGWLEALALVATAGVVAVVAARLVIFT